MLKQIQSTRFALIVTLIVIAAISRLLPHPPNFTAVGAMALFGGAMIGNRLLALVTPLLALLLSDIFLGLDIHTFAGVYLGFVLMALIGMGISSRLKFSTVTAGAILGSVVFFLLSNGWDWYANPMYSQDGIGLLQSYLMGLAFYNQEFFGSFFLNSLMANVFFSWAMFGAYKLINARDPKLSPIKVRSRDK